MKKFPALESGRDVGVARRALRKKGRAGLGGEEARMIERAVLFVSLDEQGCVMIVSSPIFGLH